MFSSLRFHCTNLTYNNQHLIEVGYSNNSFCYIFIRINLICVIDVCVKIYTLTSQAYHVFA